MKFTITKEVLIDGLQRIQGIVSNRVTLPILSNLLLEATEDGLTLTVTDREVSLRIQLPVVSLEEPGATTLPARRLLSIIRELPTEEFSLETDQKQFTSICSGPSFFKIVGLPKEEFPAFPSLEEKRGFTMKQNELLAGLNKTSYAISFDSARAVLNGILFSFKEGRLTLVATDGRRLALSEAELGEIKYPAGHECDFIVPTKAINELQRLLADDKDVRIHVGDNLVAFDLGTSVLATKLIDGKYPNYLQVIPTEATERITLERELLLQSVRRVSLLTNDKSASISLHFTENNLDITSNIPEVGEAKESLAIAYKGADLSMAFHPDFLMDPLKNLAEDTVALELLDAMSPGVFKINSAQRFLYVLMPIRASK
ncbi:MAG: DNA polymerase III subunit beta [Chthoniobacterales bacterium]|nr:DNA polymerase III subunit beta [Chthoniobacterales bacterium]